MPTVTAKFAVTSSCGLSSFPTEILSHIVACLFSSASKDNRPNNFLNFAAVNRTFHDTALSVNLSDAYVSLKSSGLLQLLSDNSRATAKKIIINPNDYPTNSSLKIVQDLKTVFKLCSNVRSIHLLDLGMGWLPDFNATVALEDWKVAKLPKSPIMFVVDSPSPLFTNITTFEWFLELFERFRIQTEPSHRPCHFCASDLHLSVCSFPGCSKPIPACYACLKDPIVRKKIPEKTLSHLYCPTHMAMHNSEKCYRCNEKPGYHCDSDTCRTSHDSRPMKMCVECKWLEYGWYICDICKKTNCGTCSRAFDDDRWAVDIEFRTYCEDCDKDWNKKKLKSIDK